MRPLHPAVRRTAVPTGPSRRTLLGGGAGLLALVLAGCGAGPGAPGGAAAEGYPRTVRTAAGDVELPRPPRRVVAMGANFVVPFLSPFLGGAPELVGYGERLPVEYTPWLADAIRGVPDYDLNAGVDLETVASWRPDVLVANLAEDGFWDDAARIAPLVQFDPEDWRGSIALVGELFEDRAAADEAVRRTEDTIAAARRADPLPVAVAYRYADPAVVEVVTSGTPFGRFLDELGLAAPDPQDPATPYEQVSLELAPGRLADAEYLVVLDFGSDAEAAGAQQALLADPVLARVPAVARGRVLALDSSTTWAATPPNPSTVPLLVDALRPLLDA